jgi:hypothetical protein
MPRETAMPGLRKESRDIARVVTRLPKGTRRDFVGAQPALQGKRIHQ